MFETIPLEILDNDVLITLLCDLRNAITDSLKRGKKSCSIFTNQAEEFYLNEMILREFEKALTPEVGQEVKIRKGQDSTGVCKYLVIEVVLMSQHKGLQKELIPLKSLESFKLTSFYGYMDSRFPYSPVMVMEDGTEYCNCACSSLENCVSALNEYVYCDAVFDCDAVFVFILEGTKIIRGWYVQK